MDLKKIIVILVHAFILWALCGATIGIGSSIYSMDMTLIIHLIGAPIFAALVSMVDFKRYQFASPMKTAIIFLSVIIVLDAGLVAPVFEKNLKCLKVLLELGDPFL